MRGRFSAFVHACEAGLVHLYSYTLLELVVLLELVLLLEVQPPLVLRPFSAAASLFPNAGSFRVLASGHWAEALYCAAERRQFKGMRRQLRGMRHCAALRRH